MSINNEKTQPAQPSLVPNRPVMSVVRFLKGGEYKEVGAVWDNELKNGTLLMKLNLSEVVTDKPVIRLVVFPKESFQKKVIDGLLTEIEHKIRQKMESPEKPDPKLPPLFQCVLYVHTKNEQGETISTERIEVGALWPNYATGELDLQLRLHAIPKHVLPEFSLFIFPHRRRLAESGTVRREPGSVASDTQEVA